MADTDIPRIIHQIWLGPRQPPRRLMQSVQQVYQDWEYRLWTERNLPPMRRQEAFDRSPSWNQKSDVLRYEVLWQHGGVYVDADSLALRPIDALLDDVDMFAGYEGHPEYPGLIATGVLGCTPGHANMARLIEELDIDAPGDAWQTVGPGYFTDAIARHQMRVTLYPSRYFYPFHHTQRRRLYGRISPGDPHLADAYFVHYWGNTTHLYEPLPRRLLKRARFALWERYRH